MFRDTVVKQVWAKDGAARGYLEVASGGDRALSDEAWQGLLTAREIQSRLVDAPGDRHAKEVRRLVRKLGIRLAKDQRGRKPKPHLPKQKRKRPPGRPRNKVELEFTGDLNPVLNELRRKRQGMVSRQPSKNQLWDSNEARRTAAEKRAAKRRDKKRRSS